MLENPATTPEEFDRFEDLTRKLVNVPKDELRKELDAIREDNK